MNLRRASLGGLAIAVLALALLIFRESLLATGTIAIAVQIAAVILMIWARVVFGRRSFHAGANPTDGGLVTSGPYRYFRHPIYAAILYFLWAGVVSHLSLLNTLLALAVTGGLALRMFAEERLVTERYPDYCVYAARTKRVIPFVL